MSRSVAKGSRRTCGDIRLSQAAVAGARRDLRRKVVGYSDVCFFCVARFVVTSELGSESAGTNRSRKSIHHLEGEGGGWYDIGLTSNGRKDAVAAAGRWTKIPGGSRRRDIQFQSPALYKLPLPSLTTSVRRQKYASPFEPETGAANGHY